MPLNAQLLAAGVDLTKTPGDFGRAGEPARGLDINTEHDVFAQKIIFDVPIPAVSDWPGKICRDYLKQKNAQCINVAVNGRGTAGGKLGGHVKTGSAAGWLIENAVHRTG